MQFMMKLLKPITAAALALLAVIPTIKAQTAIGGQNLLGQTRVITTAVPFLGITPDARSGALGDAGVAISPDANSIHWNPAKLAWMTEKFGFSASHTPWLRSLVS